MHRPPPSRAVVTGRTAEMITVARAEALGAHISVLDLYRDADPSATGSRASRGD